MPRSAEESHAAHPVSSIPMGKISIPKRSGAAKKPVEPQPEPEIEPETWQEPAADSEEYPPQEPLLEEPQEPYQEDFQQQQPGLDQVDDSGDQKPGSGIPTHDSVAEPDLDQDSDWELVPEPKQAAWNEPGQEFFGSSENAETPGQPETLELTDVSEASGTSDDIYNSDNPFNLENPDHSEGPMAGESFVPQDSQYDSSEENVSEYPAEAVSEFEQPSEPELADEIPADNAFGDPFPPDASGSVASDDSTGLMPADLDPACSEDTSSDNLINPQDEQPIAVEGNLKSVSVGETKNPKAETDSENGADFDEFREFVERQETQDSEWSDESDKSGLADDQSYFSDPAIAKLDYDEYGSGIEGEAPSTAASETTQIKREYTLNPEDVDLEAVMDELAPNDETVEKVFDLDVQPVDNAELLEATEHAPVYNIEDTINGTRATLFSELDQVASAGETSEEWRKALRVPVDSAGLFPDLD